MNQRYTYKVYRIANLDNEGSGRHENNFYVDSPMEAARLISALSIVDLQTDEVGSNVFGLLVLESEEWLEWESNDGDDITLLVDEYDNYIKVFERSKK